MHVYVCMRLYDVVLSLVCINDKWFKHVYLCLLPRDLSNLYTLYSTPLLCKLALAAAIRFRECFQGATCCKPSSLAQSNWFRWPSQSTCSGLPSPFHENLNLPFLASVKHRKTSIVENWRNLFTMPNKTEGSAKKQLATSSHENKLLAKSPSATYQYYQKNGWRLLTSSLAELSRASFRSTSWARTGTWTMSSYRQLFDSIWQLAIM